MSRDVVSKQLRRAFYLLFLLLIGNLMVQTIFRNPYFSFTAVGSIGAALLWGAVLWGLAVLLRRWEPMLVQYQNRLLCGFLLLTIATQFAFYSFAACWPVRDLEYIHNAAYEYAVTGQIVGLSQDYLYKFPNNLPVVGLLQLIWRIVYRIFGEGFTQWHSVAILLNAAAILLGYLFLFLLAEQLLGTRWGFWCWLVLYGCLPLQFLLTYYYTDTLTLPFAPMALYAWLRLRQEKRPSRKIGFAILGGLALGIGTTLKATVAIVLIAILIDALLQWDWRNIAALLLTTVCSLALCSFAVNQFAYGNGRVLDRAVAPDRATPYTNWIAMGMMGDGSYTPDTNLAVWQKETKAEKEAFSREILQQRYQEEFGSFGKYLLFLNRKGVRSFGCGDLETPQTVGVHFRKEGGLAEKLVYEQGAWHKAYEYIAQGWHLAVFGFMLLAAGLSLRKGDRKAFIPLLAVFGLYLFLLIWEASQRYLTNWLTLFVLAAACGAKLLETYFVREK